MKTLPYLTSSALLTLALAACSAQSQEGPVPTQLLVTVNSKTPILPEAASLKLELNNKLTPITSLRRVEPNGTQVAILIDDGLRSSIGVELNSLRSFVTSLPAGTEVFVGFMRNGSVLPNAPFTTDHAAAAENLRLPFGSQGIDGSPYFCLSDFVKRWPEDSGPMANGRPKARFVLLITNGVDRYNGSTSVMNQDSPYVQETIADAQRAGVSVSAIYWGDRGMGMGGRGRSANFSGQNYLAELADATGGTSYWQGTGSPVSLKPFLDQFSRDINDTFIATFMADAGSGNGKPQLLRVKLSATPKLKMAHTEEIRPGNLEGPVSPAGPAQ
jgi:hypothetical protein